MTSLRETEGSVAGKTRAAAVAVAVVAALTACHASKSARDEPTPAPVYSADSPLPSSPSPSSPTAIGPSSQVIGTLPPTSGPPAITALPGATGPAATSAPLVGQTIPSSGPVTVAGIRLTVSGTALVATKVSTGKQLWSFHDSAEPDLLEFVVGGGVVAVGVGHLVGFAMMYAATEHLDVLDLATGTPLWRTTVPGDVQSPAITAMPGLVVFDTLGHVVAVHARSGVQAWSVSSPADCGPNKAVPGPADAVSLASDPTRLVATLPCVDGVVTQRLNPATGAALWTTPIYPAGEGNLLAVPVNTDVVVIPEMGTGDYLEGPTKAWTPIGVTEAMSGGGVYTVLDDSTGRPRWTESGAPIYNTGAFGNDQGTVCFIGAHTYECRTASTGSLVRAGGPAY